MIYRRQRTQYIFAIFLAVVAVINVLFYFILTRPSQSEYAELQKSIAQLQVEIKNSERFLGNLVKSSDALREFEPEKQRLLMMRALKRNKGYSELLLKLDGIAKAANVRKTTVSLTRFSTPMPGMESVSIVIPIEGNYANVVKFISELEKSETFFLVTAISVERSTQPTGQPVTLASNAGSGTGAVALSLTLETYFYQ
jgi:Tfp pilus assembly protein PilO